MASGPIDYAQLLATWEAQRAAMDAMISSLRAAIAAGILGQVGDIPPSTIGVSGGNFQPVTGMGGEIPAGAFFGKSIPDAAKLYLEIIKKKQTSKEISEALQKGGMETNSRNFQQMVHSVLDRARKANSGIVKLDRSYWGLAAWYPAGLLRASGTVPEKRSVARKMPRKVLHAKPAKRSAPARPATPTVRRATPVVAQTAPLNGIDSRVSETLDSSAHGNVAKDIAAALSEPVGVVNFSLVRLLKKGEVRRDEDGRYYAAKERL